MKKIITGIIIFIITLLIIIGIFWNKGKDNTKKKKITIAEVAHSIFYTPMYVAHSKGFFDEFGLDVASGRHRPAGRHPPDRQLVAVVDPSACQKRIVFTVGADQFACQQVMMIGLVLLLDHVKTTELQDFVCPLPQLL